MNTKFEKIFRLAVCKGCAFCRDQAGVLMCSKFKNGEFLQSIDSIDANTCDKLKAELINQLKLTHTRLGVGFLIEPCKDDPGDATVILVGPSGKLFEGTLSTLLPNESFAVFPSLRIFNESGDDQTQAIREAALRKAYENAPESVTDPYSSLLKDNE